MGLKMAEETQLTVAPILNEKHIAKRIARISESTMKRLEVREGDIIKIKPSKERLTYDNFLKEENRTWEVKDARRTGVIVRQIKDTKEKSNSIRLDRFERENIQTVIGEKLSVKKANVKQAEEITVYPVMPGKQKFDQLEKSFLGRPVSKGDTVTFLNYFSVALPDIDKEMEIFKVDFTINNTHPDGIVLVTENTDITLETFEQE